MKNTGLRTETVGFRRANNIKTVGLWPYETSRTLDTYIDMTGKLDDITTFTRKT